MLLSCEIADGVDIGTEVKGGKIMAGVAFLRLYARLMWDTERLGFLPILAERPSGILERFGPLLSMDEYNQLDAFRTKTGIIPKLVCPLWPDN